MGGRRVFGYFDFLFWAVILEVDGPTPAGVLAGRCLGLSSSDNNDSE